MTADRWRGGVADPICGRDDHICNHCRAVLDRLYVFIRAFEAAGFEADERINVVHEGEASQAVIGLCAAAKTAARSLWS